MANVESDRAFNQGLAKLKAGDRVNAIAYIAHASQLDPSNQQAWLWLAGLTDEPTERIEYLTRLLQLNPEHPAGIKALSELGLTPEDVLPKIQVVDPTPSQQEQAPAPAQAAQNDLIGNILQVLRSEQETDQNTISRAQQTNPEPSSSEGLTTQRIRNRVETDLSPAFRMDSSPTEAEKTPVQQGPKSAYAVTPDMLLPPRLQKYVIEELRKGSLKGDVVLEVAQRLGIDWEKAEELVDGLENNNSSKIRGPSAWNIVFGIIALFVALVVVGGGYLIAPTSRFSSGPSSPIIPFIRNIVFVLSLISAVFDLDLLMINRVAMLGRPAARSLYAAIVITIIFFTIFPVFAFF